jgi:hypothetical protein
LVIVEGKDHPIGHQERIYSQNGRPLIAVRKRMVTHQGVKQRRGFVSQRGIELDSTKRLKRPVDSGID